MSNTGTLAALTKRLKDMVSGSESAKDSERDGAHDGSGEITFADMRSGESKRVRPSLNSH
jgi:hypothetical protein